MKILKPLTISEGIEQGLKNNREIATSQSDIKYQQQLRKASVEIPKMQFSGQFGQYNGYIKNDSYYSVSQTIPFPTVFSANAALGNAQIKSSELRAGITKNELVYRIKQACINLQYLYARRALLKKQDSIYTGFSSAGLKTKLQMMNINIGTLEKGNIQNAIPLYSPINSYVTKVKTNIGAYADATTLLFEIADTGHLHAELTVFEKDVSKLQIGQKVRFTLANETKERMATVALIGKEISSERTVQIHCHLDKEDKSRLSGMYLKALVESGTQEVPAVVSKAIVEYQGSKYIFIEDGNGDAKGTKYKLINVKVGVTELNFTELIFDEGTDYTNWMLLTISADDLFSKMKNSEKEE